MVEGRTDRSKPDATRRHHRATTKGETRLPACLGPRRTDAPRRRESLGSDDTKKTQTETFHRRVENQVDDDKTARDLDRDRDRRHHHRHTLHLPRAAALLRVAVTGIDRMAGAAEAVRNNVAVASKTLSGFESGSRSFQLPLT